MPPGVAVLYPFAEMVMGVGMRKLCLCLTIVLAVAVAIALAVPVLAQEDEEVKVSVIKTTTFVNETHYMLDASTNKLLDYNETYVKVLDYELQDLSASDSYYPVVVLSLDAPTQDLNTGEQIVYAWVLRGCAGDGILIAVADINTTDNSLINMSYFKISPVSGDIAIVRTSYDIVIEGEGYKLSIPLSGYNDPKVLVYTDSYVAASGISYIELRALSNPPSGYTLIRSGSGETVFTISASGRLCLWFDEEHDAGDVDMFAFDRSHPAYSSLSLTDPWSAFVMQYNRDHRHAAMIWSDSYPQTRCFDATGSVKIFVKRYSGNAAAVSWRVAARLESAPQTPPQPPTSTPTPSHSPTPTATPSPQANPAGLSGLIGRIENALSGSTALIIIVVLIIILLAIAIARR